MRQLGRQLCSAVTGQRYILAGGSGLIGRALARPLADAGADVVVLTRSAEGYRGPGRAIAWDGRRLGGWVDELEGSAGLINFTGRNVSTRWTSEARRQILSSRVDSASVIGRALESSSNPPPVWVNAGAVGIFGPRGDEILVDNAEPAPAGSDFLADVCRAWEAAVNTAPSPASVRRVILRFGVVLSADGGALPLLARVTRLFAGGRLGSGRQWVPWLHIADAVDISRRALESPEMVETYNATSPEPVTNATMMALLRRRIGRPPAPPAPEWLVRLGGKLLSLPVQPALGSERAIPSRLCEAGYTFRHPDMANALADLLGGR